MAPLCSRQRPAKRGWPGLYTGRSMAIRRDDVLHVAKLARLEIPEDEIERVQAELGAILEAVGKVSELDLEGVEPTSHPLDLVNVWGADEPRPSLSREEALANAPDPVEGAFRVPAVGG
jgi:aspartyl-tRNA(Asn)/glutamyl-tRNA(Gln) amidotransferase subunit C